MIELSHILALSQPSFVRGQLARMLADRRDPRRDNFWRGWGAGRR